MTKRRIRLLVIAAVLLLVLVLLGGYYAFYSSTKKLSFNVTASGASGAIAPPQFLFAFSGAGGDRLQRPIGIAIAGAKVFVADATRHTIFVYDQNGNQKAKFGTTQTVTPLYMAVNPKDNNLYVTDRRKRALLKFSGDGAYLGEFNPHLPKSQLPTFNTHGVQWAPIGIAFADDGTMYVTEVLKGHRLLIFNPDGTFKRSIGDAGIVDDPTKGPNVFQFPNGIAVYGGEVYVSDSNNRRIQVFNTAGDFLRMIVTEGLPRGVTFLKPFPSDPTTAPPVRLASVDTLSHFVTLWDAKNGTKIVSFGEQGTLDGQFSYPDGIALGDRNKLFITDTANGRVQVWGWPLEVSALPLIGAPTNLLWCAAPFLFLPFLLLFRKRRIFATADFVATMISIDKAGMMPGRGRAWLTLQGEYDLIKDMHYEDVNFDELFEVTEFSESDARALAEKFEIDQSTSETLAAAQRAQVFTTENTDYRRLAKAMELDVIDAQEFVKRFAKKDGSKTPPEQGADS